MSEVNCENCPFFCWFSCEFLVSLSRRASSPFGWWTSCPCYTLCSNFWDSLWHLTNKRAASASRREREVLGCGGVKKFCAVLEVDPPQYYLDRNTVPGHREHIFQVEVTLTTQKKKNHHTEMKQKINQSKKRYYQDELHVQTTVITLLLLCHIVRFNHTFS